MKKYYEILGIQEGASEQQIQEAYERLSRELSLNNKNDNITNIQKEYDKVQEAYNALIMNISNTEKIPINNLNNDSKKNFNINNKPNKSFMRNFTFKDIVFSVLLIFIATGIWGLFLQNLGYFKNEGIVVDENKVQQVRVVNTVDTNVQSGEVTVSGNVNVDNKVSVSIDEVLGEDNKKYYFNNN
jgi:hypothetical protein